MSLRRKTLLITLPPHIPGGIAVQSRLFANHLRQRGHDVTVAHYAAHGKDPDLSISAPRLLSGARPAIREEACFDNFRSVAVGCALPELEVSYTNDSPRWRTLVDAHDRHVVVSGTVLAATPLLKADVPHLIWCATDTMGDRINRQAAMPMLRRAYDRFVVGPLIRRAERDVVDGSGRIAGISPYTVDQLRSIRPERPGGYGCIPIPVDTSVFSPVAGDTIPGRIGFVGRLADPRKNLDLLLRTVEVLSHSLPKIQLVLAGDNGAALMPTIDRLGIANRVRLEGQLDTAALASFYRTLDVFVIPSHQEGLAIVGLEAMACGVPVVSTRCGGPEAFVRNNETGCLVDFDPEDMASAIAGIIKDRKNRTRLSENARALVETQYSHAGFAAALDDEWQLVWGEPV